MSKIFNVSLSPHVRDQTTSSSIMKDVVIALIPASLFGIYHFGIRALYIIAITIVTCIISEYLYEYFMKKPITINDYSAVVTGLLLALNMPSSIPLWIPIIGGIFAIIIVKQLYGGLGQNFMNPALAARCFLLISFTGHMTNFVYDGISQATPLALLKEGQSVDLLKMFLGLTGGTIGETSVIALLIGAGYLLFKHIISLRIPLTYLLSFACFMFFFSSSPYNFQYVLQELCGGGLILGAFFMATDYVTSPITEKGKIIYGIILGLLTGILRVFGHSSEGVSYAIIISNLLVPLIEKYTLPTPFGKEHMKNEK